LGVTETTFYRWRKQYTGLDVSELREPQAAARRKLAG
jgi:hypothetical protein